MNKRQRERNRIIDEYWNNNKDFIMERARMASPNPSIPLPESKVKNFWYDSVNKALKKKEGQRALSARQAIKKAMNNNIFTPMEEVYQSNVYEAIRSHKAEYKEFRHLTRDAKGRFTTVDQSNFIYDDTINRNGVNYARYTYNDVEILLANSPAGDNLSGVIVRKI